MRILPSRVLPVMFLSIAACKADPKPVRRPQAVDAKPELHTDTSMLDSVIMLRPLPREPTGPDQKLDAEIAKAALYRHFRQRGYWTADDLREQDGVPDADRANVESADFDEFTALRFASRRQPVALVTYWFAPPWASGTCWQLHKAIISATDTGFAVSNEDFIPDNHAVDSIVDRKGKPVIYGFRYDCSNHKRIRPFRLRLGIADGERQ